MNVSEIMTSNFNMVEASSSLTNAAQAMATLNVGALPVKEGTKLIGLITDRDIVVRALAQNREPSSTPVRDIISSELVYCLHTDSIEKAMELMKSQKVRRLIVCNEDVEPVGIVSLGDIAAKAREEGLAGQTLEAISEPAAPVR